MKNRLTHFAIYIDDMERAKKFYSDLFGWEFNSYGPSDFLQIKTSTSDGNELIGALQSRKYSPLSEKIIGLEGSIEVDDLDLIVKTVEANEGKILMSKTPIPFVGWITKFLDTEGNLICAVQYDKEAQ